MQHVYHLVDPITRTVRYIGKTASPKSRLRAHIKDAIERDNTEKKRWIRGLLAQGLEPVMVSVATFLDEQNARQCESAECHKHKSTIFNIHDPAKGAKSLRKQPATGQRHNCDATAETGKEFGE